MEVGYSPSDVPDPPIARSLLLVLYLVIGVLVAAGVIGDDNYFRGLSNLKELADAALAIVLWPLVLLGVGFNIAGTGHGSK